MLIYTLSGLSADYTTLGCDYWMLLVIVRKVLGPWQQGPCMEIPLLPSKSSQGSRFGLVGPVKVAWSAVPVSCCCMSVFSGLLVVVDVLGLPSSSNLCVCTMCDMMQHINVHKHQPAAAECWRKPQKENPEEAACQPTLHDTWRPNLCTMDQKNPRDGIFVHGTCYQAPRYLLAITGRPQEMELKVGWSADKLTE